MNPLGRNTVDAMRAGILIGNAGAIDRMIEAMEEAAGQKAATIVATGEETGQMLRHCRHSILEDKTLLMDGLYRLYVKNANTTKRK